MPLPRIPEHAARPGGSSLLPSEEDRRAMLNQVGRIVAHPLFTNSKRYPKFLRYVVETTLEAPGSSLKERTLGVQVFGREPDYDTNLDHIVRTTAGEVRKRLQQYYREDGHGSELIIELPSGSYVPVFHSAPASEPRETHEGKRWRVWKWAVATAAALGLGVFVVPRLWPAPVSAASDRFWSPVIAAPASAVLCIGSAENTTGGDMAAGPSRGTMTLLDLHRSESEKVAFSDALTMARLTGLLRSKGKQYQIRQEALATLAELTEAPAILIGAFDNDWTLRLTGPLRFRFEYDRARGISLIRDREHPARTDWKVDWSAPCLQFTRDYATVSRVLDRTTKQPVVVVAGITRYGTIAAGEFLANESRMSELDRLAPRGWDHRNIQIVLSTPVIRGSPGPAEIVATAVW